MFYFYRIFHYLSASSMLIALRLGGNMANCDWRHPGRRRGRSKKAML